MVSCTSELGLPTEQQRLPAFDLVAISTAGDEDVLIRRSAETGEITDLGTSMDGGGFTHVDTDGTIVILTRDGMYARTPDGSMEQLNDDGWGCTYHTDDNRFFGNRPIDGDAHVVGLFERDGTLVREYDRTTNAAMCIVPGDDYLAWWGEAPNRAHVDVWVTDLDGDNKQMIADGDHCNEIVSDTNGDLLVYIDTCRFVAAPDERRTVLVDVATGEQTDVWVVSVPDGRLLFTVPDAKWPAWVPTADE